MSFELLDVEEQDFWMGKLNPQIWDGWNLKPAVKKRLDEVVKQFSSDLRIESFVEDVLFMGSMANFNWHDKSDIDIHIFLKPSELVDIKQLRKATYLWKLENDIKVRGHVVEFYVQLSGEVAVSGGVYSLQSETWIERPEGDAPILDIEVLNYKIDNYQAEIEFLEEEFKVTDNVLDLQRRISIFVDHLNIQRRYGLLTEGEFSVGNLVYKWLRREGYLQRVWDLADKIEAKLGEIQ